MERKNLNKTAAIAAAVVLSGSTVTTTIYAVDNELGNDELLQTEKAPAATIPEAQQDVKDAQTAVDQAQKNVDSSTAAAASDSAAKEQAQKDVAASQETEKAAETKVAAASANVSAADAQVAAQQTTVDTLTDSSKKQAAADAVTQHKMM